MGAYIPKPNFDRGLMGFVLTYQPKWIKNLYIGMAGSTSYYKNTKDSTGKSSLDPYPYFVKTDKGQNLTLGSVFFRYAMPDDKAEIYGEFGRSDKLATPFNIVGDTIPLGFVFGIRKWLKISRSSPIANAKVIVETAAMLSPSVASLPPFLINVNERKAVRPVATNNAASMVACDMSCIRATTIHTKPTKMTEPPRYEAISEKGITHLGASRNSWASVAVSFPLDSNSVIKLPMLLRFLAIRRYYECYGVCR